MLRTTNFCVLCCTDLRRDPKTTIKYPYDYTLVGLVEALCRNLNGSIESIFGKPDLNFAKEKLAVCVKCKKILVRIFGLEAEIESIKKQIKFCVQDLTARCLSCGVHKCSVCQENQAFKNLDGLVGAEDQDQSRNDKTLGSVAEDERLKERLGSKYLPQVSLQDVNPEESARLHGLTIYTPKPVAPNEFIELSDVLDTGEYEPLKERSSDDHSSMLDEVAPGPSLVLATDEIMELSTFVDTTDGIDINQDDSKQVQDTITSVTFININPGIIEAQRLTLNGEPLFESTELGYKCLKCKGETIVAEEELSVHYLAHGGTEISFVIPAALQEVPATVEQDPASSPPDTQTAYQPQAGPVFDWEKFRRRRKDNTTEAIMSRESPQEFLKQYQLLNAPCPEQETQEFVSVYKLGDDLYLLENQWKFEFREGDGYLCLTCSEKFLTPTALVAHCRAQHGISGSSGTIVDSKMMSDFSTFRRKIRCHIRSKENWRANFYTVCSKSRIFLKPFDYLTRAFEGGHFVHANKLKFHVNKDWFVCDSCEFKEKWKSAFVDHLFEAHADEQTTGVNVRVEVSLMEQISPGYFSYRGYTCRKVDNKFYCDTCQYQAADKKTIRTHLYMSHYNKNRYICGICHVRFVSKRKLVVHTKKHEESNARVGRKRVTPGGLEKLTEIAPNKLVYRGFGVTRVGDDFVCDTCSYKSPKRQNMYQHLYKIHHRNRPKRNYNRGERICETCGKVFSNSGTFYCHWRKHQLETKLGHFTCEVCGKTKTNAFEFATHIRRHREKKVACPECGKKYHHKSLLDVHMLTHSEERNHVCLQCNKSYKSRESLQLHCKSHNGVKPYSCDICLKTFTQSYSVTKHKRSMHADVLQAAASGSAS